MIAYILIALIVLFFTIAVSGYVIAHGGTTALLFPVVGVAKVHEIPRERLLDVLNAIAEVLEAPSVIRTKIAKTKLRTLLGEVVPKAFEGIGFWYIKMDGNTPYLVVTDVKGTEIPLDNFEIELDEGWHSVDLTNCTKKSIRFETVKIRPK